MKTDLPVRPGRPPAPLVPGYQLGAPLGVGAGGPVWSGVRTADGRPVAVKVLGPAPGSRSELAALRAVHHPHVVRLVEDVPLGAGALALILERVDGGSLARVVGARGHLTPAETVTILTALGTTLADLHGLGLVHGDLAPGNVLFQPDGRPVLADLGLARLAARADAEPAGTDGFVDPVVLAGGEPGPAADAYSLAALGWYCLAGRSPGPPLLRPDLAAICPDAPAALVAVIDAGLTADPLERVSPGELAWSAYAACAPGPVRLATGADPAAALTRRIRVRAVDPEDQPVDRPGPVATGRWRRVWRAIARAG